eukprot:GHVS01029004.1.p1 GENE.GHVS01029004.1~~GHVS01029004.1.p1  ORF type:complete len:234 (+),score=40.52 GHVS01029004.1:29-703(+)
MTSFAASPFLQRQVPTGANAPSSFYSDAYIKMDSKGVAMAEIARIDEDVLTRMKQTRDNYVHTLREADRYFEEQLQVHEALRRETATDLQRLTELHKAKQEERVGEEGAGEENVQMGTCNRQGTDEHDDIVDLKHHLCEKKMELHKLKSQRIRLEAEKTEMQRRSHAANEKLKHEVILLKGIIHKNGSAVCNEQPDLTIDELDQLYEKLLTHHKDMTKVRPNAF